MALEKFRDGMNMREEAPRAEVRMQRVPTVPSEAHSTMRQGLMIILKGEALVRAAGEKVSEEIGGDQLGAGSVECWCSMI